MILLQVVRLPSRFAPCGRRLRFRSGSNERYQLSDVYGRRLFTAGSAGFDDKNQPGASSDLEWRKHQLDKLERRFTEPSVVVDSDEDLQPMWKEMEGRVTRRKPRTLAQTGGKSGRENIRKTDEEMWLEEGLYDKKEGRS